MSQSSGSYQFNAFPDTANFDAFGRLRTSHTQNLFNDTSEYGLNLCKWEISTSGTGTNLSITNQSAVRLSTGGTGNGALSIKQSRYYCRYQPGTSQLFMATFVMGSAVTNSVARVGMFDSNNGLFLERSTDNSGVTTINVVRRTFTSGSPVDTAIAQSGWNLDKCDGTGSSGFNLDLTKSQILIIDYQWLGSGRVRYGFSFHGQTVWVHELINVNNLTTVYVQSGALPVRYEVRNTGVSNGTLTMDTICAVVSAEGVVELSQGNSLSASNGTNTKSVSSGTMIPVLSIRASVMGPNKSVTNHSQILPRAFSIVNTGNSAVYFELRLNASLTNSSFTNVSTTSAADYDTSATAFLTNGAVITSGYIPSTNQNNGSFETQFFRGAPLVYTNLGSVQDVLTVGVAGAGGSSNVAAALTWQELY